MSEDKIAQDGGAPPAEQEARPAANEQLAQAQADLARAKAAVKATGQPTSSDEEDDEDPAKQVPCPFTPCDKSFERGDQDALTIGTTTVLWRLTPL